MGVCLCVRAPLQDMLDAACEAGSMETVKWLVECRRVDVTHSGDCERYGRGVDPKRSPPLVAAAARGHTQLVQYLIDAGAAMRPHQARLSVCVCVAVGERIFGCCRTGAFLPPPSLPLRGPTGYRALSPRFWRHVSRDTKRRRDSFASYHSLMALQVTMRCASLCALLAMLPRGSCVRLCECPAGNAGPVLCLLGWPAPHCPVAGQGAWCDPGW